MALSFTWLGHATFLFRSPGGKRILTDPWVAGNPACPEPAKKIGDLDLILVSHGHSDHTGDLVSIARATGAHVIANYEICLWIEGKGIQNTAPMGHGGSQTIGGITFTMVNAVHGSSALEDGRLIYLGHPAGFIVRFEDGLTVYFAGDTDLFGDMRLIGEMYKPAIAFLPIGDRFTMGPEAAARAVELLGVRQVVPMHFATFPFLTGTPDALRRLVEPKGVEVLELRPGETAS
jgi:L-ascorbate metabolism protein UlaG (beta-lactamase superfamily)